MAVLGSMLIDKEAVETILELLQEDHFYKDAHRSIFRAASTLSNLNQAVDMITITEELRRQQTLDAIGGPTYLSEIVHSVSTAAHAEHYARLVREKAILRELITTCTKVVSRCYQEEKEIALLLDEAQAQILTVAQKQPMTGFVESKKLAHEVIEDIDRLHKRGETVTGISTGLKAFDKKTAGLQKGDLILIAARPSQGKTALALNMAAHIVLNERDPRPVAFFSLEMTRHALMTRLIASEARANLGELRTGFFRRDRWAQITTAASRLSEAPLFINDLGLQSVLEMRSSAKRLANELRKRGQELGVIMIDYLQLMRGPSRRVESRQQEVSEISRGLKFLARDLNVPVVALSQLNRRAEDKGRPDGRPQLSDLRESGALEQDADLVAFIYREGQYKREDPTLQNKAEIIVAKQRNGPTGSFEVSFLQEYTRFENLTVESQEAEPLEETAFL
jgi:replicative DNA helicase